MSIFGNQCQSCGMPLSKDPQGGGSEANGTKSTKYCSHCYLNGKFSEPDIKVHEMVTKVQNIMCDMKFPKFMAKFFTRKIPKLDRWKAN